MATDVAGAEAPGILDRSRIVAAAYGLSVFWLTLSKASATTAEQPAAKAGAALVLAWLAVGIPIAWGVWMTLRTAVVLFRCPSGPPGRGRRTRGR